MGNEAYIIGAVASRPAGRRASLAPGAREDLGEHRDKSFAHRAHRRDAGEIDDSF